MLFIEQIDQSIAIVTETALNSDRANFPLKSKAENSDGLIVGSWPRSESLCAENSAHYND
jgi:hypothetical protein